MKKKRFLSILLVLIISSSLIINDVKEVKATGLVVAGLVLTGLSVVVPCVIAAESDENYQNWYQNTYRPNYQENIRQLFQLVGLPASSADIIGKIGGDPIQNVRIWLASRNNTTPENITDNQCMEELYNMYSGCTVNANDDAFVFSGDLKNYTQYLVNEYKDNSGFWYGYSYNMEQHATQFNNGAFYSAVKELLETKDDSYIAVMAMTFGQVAFFSGDYGLVNYNSNMAYDGYTVQPYDSNWNIVPARNFENYTWNGSALVQNGTFQDRVVYCSALKINTSNIGASGMYCILSTGKTKTYKIYKTLSDLKSAQSGNAPYYVTQYNGDFMNNSGNTTYTIDNSNYNPVTYDDIYSYVNSFNSENGNYPNPEQIQVYIENYIPPQNGGGNNGSGNGGSISQNTSGGSASASANATNGDVNVVVNNNPTISLFPTLSGNSVSGNTVSGNQVENGVSDIFSFLSGIGKALGSLVKNLGTALTELLTSLVEVINDLVVKIPQTLNSFVNIVFGALPEEIRSLIILGVTSMIVYGIIKMIRG